MKFSGEVGNVADERKPQTATQRQSDKKKTLMGLNLMKHRSSMWINQ